MGDPMHFRSYSMERLFTAGLALVANTSHGDLMSANGAFALYRSCSSCPGRVEWSGTGDREGCAYACARTLFSRGVFFDDTDEDDPEGYSRVLGFLTKALGRAPLLEIAGEGVFFGEDVGSIFHENCYCRGKKGHIHNATLPSFLHGLL